MCLELGADAGEVGWAALAVGEAGEDNRLDIVRKTLNWLDDVAITSRRGSRCRSLGGSDSQETRHSRGLCKDRSRGSRGL